MAPVAPHATVAPHSDVAPHPADPVIPGIVPNPVHRVYDRLRIVDARRRDLRTIVLVAPVASIP